MHGCHYRAVSGKSGRVNLKLGDYLWIIPDLEVYMILLLILLMVLCGTSDTRGAQILLQAWNTHPIVCVALVLVLLILS